MPPTTLFVVGLQVDKSQVSDKSSDGGLGLEFTFSVDFNVTIIAQAGDPIKLVKILPECEEVVDYINMYQRITTKTKGRGVRYVIRSKGSTVKSGIFSQGKLFN